MSSNQTPAYVRTGAPIAAGPIIVTIAKAFGLDVSTDQVLMIVPVVSFAYYVLGRALESYNPKLGYVLGIAKAPAYSAESSPSPGKGEDVVAEVVPEVLPEVEPESFEPDPVEETEPIQPLVRSTTPRSTPLHEVRKAAAKKAPAKKAPTKKAPKPL